MTPELEREIRAIVREEISRAGKVETNEIEPLDLTDPTLEVWYITDQARWRHQVPNSRRVVFRKTAQGKTLLEGKKEDAERCEWIAESVEQCESFGTTSDNSPNR
jgi:hypothetical protein